VTQPSDICVTVHKHDPDRERRAVDGLWLCHGCLGQLRDLLDDLPGLHARLGTVLATGGDGGQRVSGSPSEPLPVNTAVIEHQQQIRHDLVWWCVYVADERGIARPGNGDPVTTAAWLTRHVDWCAGNRPAAEELLLVLRQLAGRARAMLDPDRYLPTGERCRVTGKDGERCDGTVTMRQSGDEAWKAWCSSCGPQLPGAYMADSVDGRWVTIERVEAYVLRVHGRRVDRATIRSWAVREHVQVKEEHEKTWYDLGSVHKYLDERSKREMMSA